MEKPSKEVLEAIIAQKTNITQVALEVGMSYSKTRTLIKKYNLKSYPRGQRKRLNSTKNFALSKEEIKHLYVDNKLSLRKIASLMLVSYQTIHNWLRAYEVDTKSSRVSNSIVYLYSLAPKNITDNDNFELGKTSDLLEIEKGIFSSESKKEAFLNYIEEQLTKLDSGGEGILCFSGRGLAKKTLECSSKDELTVVRINFSSLSKEQKDTFLKAPNNIRVSPSQLKNGGRIINSLELKFIEATTYCSLLKKEAGSVFDLNIPMLELVVSQGKLKSKFTDTI